LRHGSIRQYVNVKVNTHAELARGDLRSPIWVVGGTTGILSPPMLNSPAPLPPEIHPYLRFWGDFAKNAAEILAIVIGGMWTYFLFLRVGL